MGAVCGIMITASHNPACDNGIKIFAEDGFKLPDSVELEIEKEMLEGTLAEEGVPCENIGKAYRIEDARGRYIEYAKGSIQNLSLRGLRIVLDCANGAAYSIGAADLPANSAPRSSRPRSVRTGSISTTAAARSIRKTSAGLSESIGPMPESRSTAMRTGSSSATRTAKRSTATASSACWRSLISGSGSSPPTPSW